MASEIAPLGSDSSTAPPAATATDVNQLVEVKAKDQEEKSKEAAVEEMMNREKVVKENGHEYEGSISKGEPILEIEQQEEKGQAEAEAGPVLVEIQPSPSSPSELSDSPAKQLKAPVVTNVQVPLNDKFQSSTTTTTTGENPKEEEIAASSEKVESSTENHQMKVTSCPASLPREKRPAEAEDSVEVAKLDNPSFEALKSENSEDSTKEDEDVQAAGSEKSEVSYKDDAQVVNEQIGTANNEVSVKVADAESSQQVQSQIATELKQNIGDSSKQQEPTSKRETVIAVEKEMVSKEDNVNAVVELFSETSPKEVSNQEVQPIKDIQQISKIIASKHQEQTDTKCVADKVLEEQATSSSDNLTDVAREAISTAMAEESPEAKIEIVKEEASIVTVNKKGKTEVTKSEEVVEKDKFEMVKVEEEKVETTKAEEEDSETVKKEEKNGTLKAEDEEEEKTEASIYKKLGEKAQSSSSSETVKDNETSAEATAVSASNGKASSAAAEVTSENVSSKSEETPQKEAITEDSKVVSSREFAATDNKKKIDDGSESPPKLIEETKNVDDKTNFRKGGGVLHTVGSKVMQSMQKLKNTISCGKSSAVK